MDGGTYLARVFFLATLASAGRGDSFDLTRFYSVHVGTPLVEAKGPSAAAPNALLLAPGSVSFALSQLPTPKIGFLPVLRTNLKLASGKNARLRVEKAGSLLYAKPVGSGFEPLTIVLGPVEPSARLRFIVESEDPGARVLLDYPTIEAMWAIPLRAMPAGPGHWTAELSGLLGAADYRLVTPVQTTAACEARAFLSHREPITQTFSRSHDDRARIAPGERAALDVPLGFFHRTEKLAWHLEAACPLSLGTTYLLESGPAKKLGVRIERISAESLADRFSPLNQTGIPWARGGLVRATDTKRFLELKAKGFQVVLHVDSEATVRKLAALGKKLELLEVSDPKLLLALHRLRESGELPAFTPASLVYQPEGAFALEAARAADVVGVPADDLDGTFEKVGRAKPIWIVESAKHRLSTARDPLALLESIQAAAQHPMAQVTAVFLDENEPGPGTAAPPESRMLGAYNP